MPSSRLAIFSLAIYMCNISQIPGQHSDASAAAVPKKSSNFTEDNSSSHGGAPVFHAQPNL